MNKRMSLVDGIERDRVELDPKLATEFIKQTPTRSARAIPQVAARPTDSTGDADDSETTLQKRKIAKGAVIAPSPIPIHVRVRPELASALKAASLDRELKGIHPFTQKDIVEEALEPWLRENGFLA